MIVKYYKSSDLKYTSRKRYQIFNFESFAEEEQKAILLGDGATTTIKTKSEHICDYVTIDNTRWFVLYYTYINGGQVILYLQRDVFGEKGIAGCFGKVERGYTNTFLKNRKELGLNQILKNRKAIKPDTNIYGNYTVNNHNNEMWGVLYFVKPTGNDPSTGEPYPEQVNINIPEFSPNTVDYPFIGNNTIKIYDYDINCRIRFIVEVNPVNRYFEVDVGFSKSSSGKVYSVSKKEIQSPSYITINVVFQYGTTGSVYNSFTEDEINYFITQIGNLVGQSIIDNDGNSGSVFNIPSAPTIDSEPKNYNNVTIEKDNKFYKYTVSLGNSYIYGSYGSNNKIASYIYNCTCQKSFNYNGRHIVIFTNKKSDILYPSSFILKYEHIYTYRELTPSEAGQITISTKQQLVDEPYSILVFPLFNVSITGGEKPYNIDKDRAFQIFNTVIQYLSGEKSYIVDAQIYPYCPVLDSVASELQGYPFFNIVSTSYSYDCSVQLLPSSDVKKEYIERQYSIISPEQSGKFSFNFYDYKNKINDNNGVNFENITIRIKTALKPFAIISSAVIIPDSDSLIGITYSSDLRGCQPSSNGFECSLSSNAFESYKRQNSNYQQIFALQKEELINQQNIERTNEMVSGIVNTVNASTMGAIGGAAIGDIGILPFTKSAGAVSGSAIGAAAVGAANIAQQAINEKARQYELSLQQQRFDLEIGTIKNLPNSINRISSFNEIILQNFYFVIETYECSNEEKEIVNNFIEHYGYSIGVFDLFSNYIKKGWFIKGSLITSQFDTRLHMIAETELKGGIYLYE